MCGRYMLDSNFEDLIEEYKISKDHKDDYREGVIYPSQDAPIVHEDGDRFLSSARWGFPLAGTSQLVINARSESIGDKAMFRDAFNTSRCIIPASLFYEWKEEGKNNKVKHLIYLKDKRLISFGGIIKYTLDAKANKKILSFVIITTDSNKYMRDIHSRMPLIIENDSFDYWLDKSSSMKTIEDIIQSNISHQLEIERENKDEQLKLF